MEKANQSINLGGQPFVNHWLSKNNNATADDIAVGVILMYRYQAIGDDDSMVAVRYIENNICLASQLPECRDKQILCYMNISFLYNNCRLSCYYAEKMIKFKKVYN